MINKSTPGKYFGKICLAYYFGGIHYYTRMF